MIKIRAWYDHKMYFHVEHVTYSNGSSKLTKLGDGQLAFPPDPSKDLVTMLWTGLRDKSGKEIWEGDVVEHYYKGKHERCEVIFIDGLFCLKWKDGYINRYLLNPGNYNVIGNIFEMPDWKNY
jgi:hypothetical protein